MAAVSVNYNVQTILANEKPCTLCMHTIGWRINLRSPYG